MVNSTNVTCVVEPEAASGVAALLVLIERLILDPNVDAAKLEKIFEFQDRLLQRHAKALFDEAFAAMLGELPTIAKLGEVEIQGKRRNTYARHADIQEAIRPVLQRHGFSLRFRHEHADHQVKVIGLLSHRGGHTERDEFLTGADVSGNKNDIQALGSARSYGQRYTTMALLNIATRDDDDGDGTAARSAPQAVAPTGFEAWFADLQSAAVGGERALKSVWESKPAVFRKHLVETRAREWDQLKHVAREADRQITKETAEKDA